MTKAQRLIELMVRVYERRQFTVEEMASEFGVSYRTMLRYTIAGIEARRSVPVPGGMTAIDFPSREYAVYTHHGTHGRDELDDTYLLAVARMREQGMEPEHDAYSLTFYADGEPPEASQCEIYIPIRAMCYNR